MTMRSLSLAALLSLALVAALPLAAGQAAAPGRYTDPGITNGSKERRLDSARKAWKAAGVSNYSYLVGLSCFCPPRPDVKITVRRGRPAAGTPKDLRDLATVPRLFRKIQDAIDDKVSGIKVTYGKRGVPLSIAIDRDRRIADEESYYTLKRFTVL